MTTVLGVLGLMAAIAVLMLIYEAFEWACDNFNMVAVGKVLGFAAVVVLGLMVLGSLGGGSSGANEDPYRNCTPRTSC